MKRDEALGRIKSKTRDMADKLGTNPPGQTDELDSYDQALTDALAVYSQYRPRRRNVTLPCGANGRIATAGIAGFDESFIALMRIEFPVIATGQPQWLNDGDWILDQDSSDASIVRFTKIVPQEGALVRIVHFVEHVLPAKGDDDLTVIASDSLALIMFGVKSALDRLSSEYAQASEHSSGTAQVALFINKSGIYATRAKEAERQAFAHLRVARVRAEQSAETVRG